MACHRLCHRQREDERAGPHFFKIILSHTVESGMLGIPRRFLRKHRNDLSSSVLLKVPHGSTWLIELKKDDNGMVWLGKGWREFMEHYSIGHGHLIVFKYEGDSIFHAIIFDKTASEIDYSSSSSGASNGLMKQSRCGESHYELVFHGPTCPRPLSRLKLANKFESEHPSFKVVMQPSYIKTSLSIPRGFVKKHIHKGKETATLMYLNRSWLVRIIWSYSCNHKVSLSAGWPAFARETCLHAQDVCVFELIDENEIVFNVSIFDSAGKIKQSACRPTCPSLASFELASKFESDYPFFMLVMQPTHIQRHMRVPRGFIKQHIKEANQTVTLGYSDRSWLVEFTFSQRLRTGFFSSTGWSVFTKETRLRVRDVCVFELTGCGLPVFKVSIFRSLGPELIDID